LIFFGKPIDVEGEIFDDQGQVISNFKSYYHGMGSIKIIPEKGQCLKARITRPKGINQVVDLPMVEPTGVQLSVLNQSKQTLDVQVEALNPVDGFLLLQKGEEVLFAKKIEAVTTKPISIPTADIGIGISRLTLLNSDGVPQCERLVFLNRYHQLNIEIETDKEQYLEQEEVNLKVKISDHLGNPVEGQFALSVTDEQQLTMVDDRQGHILSSLLLEQELKGDIEDPNFYFDDDLSFRPDIDRDQAIDLLMLTQGWRRFEWDDVREDDQVERRNEKEQAVFAGKVVDGFMNPIEGASVEIKSLSGFPVYTDKMGRFKFSGFGFPNRKPIQIGAAKSGFDSAIQFVTAYSSDITLVLSKGDGAIVGYFENEARPINLMVSRGEEDWPVPIDAKGAFSFHHLPEGLYALNFTTKEGIKHTIDSIAVYCDRQTEVKLNIQTDQPSVVDVRVAHHSIAANMVLSRKWDHYMEYQYSNSFHLQDVRYTSSAPTEIHGQVVDETGEPQIAATVVVERNGVFVTGTNTDFDGYYKLPLDPGTYDVTVSYTGFPDYKVENVRAFAGYKAQVDVTMADSGVLLESVVVTEYKVPLIEQHNTMSAGTISSEDIRSLPTLNIAALAANTAGIRSDVGDHVTILSGRANGTGYYIDGIRVSGNIIPETEIDQLQYIPPEPSGLFPEFNINKEREIAERLRPNDRMNELSPTPLEVPSYKWVKLYYTQPKVLSQLPDQLPRFLGCRKCNKMKDPIERQRCSDAAAQEYIQGFFAPQPYSQFKKEYIQFTINEDGLAGDFKMVSRIGEVQVRGASRRNEYYRQFNKLKTYMAHWQPARKNERQIGTAYMVPIWVPAQTGEFKIDYTPKVQYYNPVQSEGYSNEDNHLESPTLFWSGMVLLDSLGQAQIQFRTGTQMATYQATIGGLGAAHQIGRGVHTFSVKPPMSVVAKFPSYVRDQDQLSIPITVVNNTDQKLLIDIYLYNQQDYDREIIEEVEVEPNGQIVQILDMKVEHNDQFWLSGQQQFTLEVEDYEYDHIVRDKFQLEVFPKGFPDAEVFTGTEQKNTFEIDLTNALTGTVNATFRAHPFMVTELMSTLEKMIRQPSGCFEQTSSSNYPNILAIQLLRDNGFEYNVVERDAQQYLKDGYSRLTSYEVEGGGFDWFGKGPSHEGLTAYGLLQFVDMQKVFPVEQALIDRTAKWLMSRKDGKGGWQSGKRGLHSWKGSSDIRNAYIVWALTEAGYGEQITLEINQVYDQVIKSNDPYLYALMANALLKQKDQRGLTLLEKLRSHQSSEGYWNGKTCSIVNSKGINLQVETTALAMLAFQKAEDFDQSEALLQKSLIWLLEQKGSRGYGSTQATVLALKAILRSLSTPKEQKGNGILALSVDGVPVQKFYFKPGKYSSIQRSLNRYLNAGEKHQVEVVFEKGDYIPFEIDLAYQAVTQPGQQKAHIAIDSEFLEHSVQQGQTVRLTTTLSNPTKKLQTSPIAIIGLPAGLQPQPWQLRELMEKEVIDYYEIKDKEIVFYLLELAPKERRTINLDLEAVSPGTYFSGAGQAYLYYENDVVVWSAPQQVEVVR